MTAIIGDLSITLTDGTTLTDRTDVGLARQWAEHEHGPQGWANLTLLRRNTETALALRALRHACEQA